MSQSCKITALPVFALTAVSLLIMVAPAHASIVIQFTEDTVANQTTIALTGSLNTSAFPAPAQSNYALSAYVSGASGLSLAIFPSMANFYAFSTPFVQSFGTGGYNSGTFLGTDAFSFDANGALPDQLYLPLNYVSNAPLHSSGLFSGTFATLGITPSTVVMNLPSGTTFTPVGQTITLQFASVPEPAAGALLVLAALILRRR